MYGILGSSIRSRFVFLAVPDHGEPPDLKDLKRLLNCSDVNIYKADGYFKHSFSEIEWLLYLHKRGITHETSWSLNQKFFSHVIKLSSKCEWNAMAEIKYSQQLVIRLELDEQKLRNLDNLLRGIRKLKSQLSEGNNAHSAVHRAIESLRKVELMRNLHRIPTDADIEAIFDQFGEFERQQYEIEIESWLASTQWAVATSINPEPMHSSLA